MTFATTAATGTARSASLVKRSCLGNRNRVATRMKMSSATSVGAGTAPPSPSQPSAFLRRGMMASAQAMPRPKPQPAPGREHREHYQHHLVQPMQPPLMEEESEDQKREEVDDLLRRDLVTPADVPLRAEDEREKSASEAFPMWLGLDIEPREYSILTKSKIKDVFDTHMGAGALDHRPYVAAASVLPMRTNNYVVEDLIDWQKVPEDPMFQLVFPQPGMLSPQDLQRSMAIIDAGVKGPLLREAMEAIRAGLNPHPAGQKTLNVPSYDGEQVEGMQHKYRETVLFFATEAQYCHSFCTYCFRWAQFTAVGSSQQFASKDAARLRDYLRANRDVSDVLFTGGDPMVMNAKQLAAYVDPILQDPSLEHVATIRFGTKAVAYWPYRFVTDPDADETLRVFQRIVDSGRHVSIMAHFSHPNELAGPVPQEAIRRIRSTGANVRTQAPLINHVNADAATWASMWRLQTRLGAIPYYMFVERDTGARKYFEVPLAKAYDIFSEASMATSGTVRTVRGPSMSATPGKVQVVGITSVKGEKVFVLRFLQARNPDWCKEVFFAKYDEKAMWLDDLRPAFGEDKFFYEDELARLSRDSTVSSGQAHPLPAQPSRVSQGSDTSEAGRGLSGAGRGISLSGGIGDMRYRNGVISPAPVARQDQ